MLQAELDRICLCGERQLVHEALDRENIHIGAERAHRRDTQRHVRQEMMHHLRIREDVERDGVAVPASFGQGYRLRRRHGKGVGHMLGREEGARRARPHRMRVAPHFVAPVSDLAHRVEPGRDLRHHSRPIRLPCLFLLAHPLQADRRAGHARGDQSRVPGRIVGAVMAVAARAFHMDAAYLVQRQPQHLGDRGPVWIDALGMGPDGNGAVNRRPFRLT